MKIIGYLFVATAVLAVNTYSACGRDPLSYTLQMDAVVRTLTMPDGRTVNYKAYEQIYYVSKVVDSTYQYLNFFVPETAFDQNRDAPVFLKTNIGGYMAAKAGKPSATDATGRALLEGYIVVIPGSRGANSVVSLSDGSEFYTGRAPAGIVDLKAAVRFLRHNDKTIPGNKERIVTDGTSAGGAMSALLGSTGNNRLFEPYLKEIGAAEGRDDVFASVCYCPITDLPHADMAYEWIYGFTNGGIRGLNPEQSGISDELAAMFPAYIDSLGLRMADGTPITIDNYREYIKSFLIRSAQRARDEGAVIDEEMGFTFNKGFRGQGGDFVIGLDLDKYLEFVAAKTKLKNPPAFDQKGVLDSSKPSPENNVFGDSSGSSSNFTDFGLRNSTGDPSAVIDEATALRVCMMNPMNFIGGNGSVNAPYWYIRHGAMDRDTSFAVPINLYTKLLNSGYEVNFALPWNRTHSGDYSLDDLFSWLNGILNK